MQQSRTERLERIRRAIADDEEPKRRDTHPHVVRWPTGPEKTPDSA